MVTTPEKSISQFPVNSTYKVPVWSIRRFGNILATELPEPTKRIGSLPQELAMVQETENDDLEWGVKLTTLEGDDLKWVNWEEEDDDEGDGEAEVSKRRF
ncbi:unnamed protein product [Brassica oleracea]